MTRRRSFRELENEIEELGDRIRTPADVDTSDVEVTQEMLDAIEAVSVYRLEHGTDEPLPDELREQLASVGFDPDEWPPEIVEEGR